MPTVAPSPDTHAPTRRTPVATTELVAAGGVGALGVAFLLSPEGIEDGPVLCPFRLLTGLPCPGCGLTRAWVYLAHGQYADSLAANPFGWLLVGVTLALAVAVVVARVRRRPAPDLNRLARHPLTLGVLAVWIGFAVVRIALTL
jgi:hypothetical protein